MPYEYGTHLDNELIYIAVTKIQNRQNKWLVPLGTKVKTSRITKSN